MLSYIDAGSMPGAKAAKLWRTCSLDFTMVAIYLVVQIDLSRWKVVCSGYLGFTIDNIADNSRQGEHITL